MRRALVLLVLALLPAAAPVRAQTTSGTLVGVVFDTAQSPLAGARVTAVNELNGNSRSTVTAPDGSYRLPFMPPGRYTIRVSMAGFADNQITGFPIPLNSATNLVPPITLLQGTAPAAPTAPVASGDERASLVNTNDATRRGNFSREQVETLPLGGTTDTRTFDELALLVSGVAPAPYVPGVRGPGVGFGIGTAGQFSVNGARARSNNFTVDGSDNNDPDVGVRRQGFVTLIPQSVESVQEFQLSTLLWDAAAGRNVGSQVNAVSKSGGNEVHGTLYGFFTDSALNARNAYDFTGGASGGESPYTRVQAGFVLGAPIRRDRTQVFVSFEHIDVNAAVEQHFSTPKASDRRFAGAPRFGVVHSPVFQNALNYVTEEGTTPIGGAVLALYPLPNNPQGPYGANNYTEVLPASGEGRIFSVKVTHRFSDDNVLNARYNFGDDERILPSVNRAIRSTINSETRTQNLSIIFDTTLGASTFNQARISYGRTRLEFPEHPQGPFLFSSTVDSAVRFLPVAGGEPGDPVTITASTSQIGQLVVEPFSPVGVDAYTFPQGRVNNVYQLADALSWRAGRHSLTVGGEARRVELNGFQDRLYRPLVTFNNGARIDFDPEQPRPSARLEFLQGAQLAAIGLPSSISQSLTNGPPNSTIGLRYTELNAFVNDSWRVRPNLVFDLGLRYEYNTVPREQNERIEGAIGLRNLPQAGGSMFDRPTRTNFFMLAAEGYRNVLGGRGEIYDSDTNNFGPHVGFAWDPWSDGRTSIRGGYGVVFDAILGAVVTQSRNVFPNEVPVNIAPSFLPFLSFYLPLPGVLILTRPDGEMVPAIVPGTINQVGGGPEDFVALIGELFRSSQGAGGLAYTLPARDLATPYMQQWHLSVEREIPGDVAVSAAYVGTKGTKLTRLVTPNNGPGITPVIPVANFRGTPVVIFDERFNDLVPDRPANRFLGAYQIYENSASSSYHALQLEARKRYSQGYTFTFAYTWSHAIDELSDLFPIAGAPLVAQDSRNLALERGDASYDVRHRFAASLVWELPVYRDSAAAGPGEAAFWLGGWRVSSIAQGHTGQPFTLNLPIDINLDGNFTDRPATTEGLVFFDEHGPRRVAIADGADPSAFFDVGGIGRNTVRGDGFLTVDLALDKAFRLGESQTLLVRGEAFNLLNRTNYGLPIRVLGNPGFGSAVETATPARVVQFAVKYSF